MPATIQPDQLLQAAQQAAPKVVELLTPFTHIDVSMWPFWLGLLSLPFGLFEMYAKPMMDSLNGMVKILVIAAKGALVLLLIASFVFVAAVVAAYLRRWFVVPLDVSSATQLFYISFLTGLGLLCFWGLSTVCRFISHGSYITGACFIMTLISVYIEVVDEFGQMGLYGFIGGVAIAALFWGYKLRQIRDEQAKTQHLAPRMTLRERVGAATA